MKSKVIQTPTHPSPSGLSLLLIWLLAFGVIGFIFYRNGGSGNGHAPATGAATLSKAGADRLPVCIDEATWSEVIALARKGDVIEKERLVAGGRMFRVANGTRITVDSAGFSLAKIRVSEGEFAGRAGVVPSEWIAR